MGVCFIAQMQAAFAAAFGKIGLWRFGGWT